MKARALVPGVIEEEENRRVIESALDGLGEVKLRVVVSAYAPEVTGTKRRYWTLLGEGGSVTAVSEEGVERFLSALRAVISSMSRS
jgi:hypothetical protein